MAIVTNMDKFEVGVDFARDDGYTDISEWVVVEPPKRCQPTRTHFSMPANQAEMIQDSLDFGDSIRIALSLDYKYLKQLVELVHEKEMNGELDLPNDEIIMEYKIDVDSSKQRTTGLCTPFRNSITGR